MEPGTGVVLGPEKTLEKPPLAPPNRLPPALEVVAGLLPKNPLEGGAPPSCSRNGVWFLSMQVFL